MGLVDALVVAGGGAGGSGGWGGAGGAGGYLYSPNMLIVSGSYAITVGTGGVGVGDNNKGANGLNSVFSTLTAIGGGGGGGFNWSNPPSVGGSGGGGDGDVTRATAGAAGTAGQGYAGAGGSNDIYSGGGGGAGGAASGITGGIGVSNSITGTAVTYCIGGTGKVKNPTEGWGSTGPGYGGGGGGTPCNAGGYAGMNGNQGVVIVRYLTGKASATGGTITTANGYTIHTFTTSGTLDIAFLGNNVHGVQFGDGFSFM